MSDFGPVSYRMRSCPECHKLKAAKRKLAASNKALLSALKGLVDCISETRGKSAYSALEKAREAIRDAEAQG